MMAAEGGTAQGRVVVIGREGRRSSQMSDPNFADLSEQSRSFEALAQYQPGLVSVSGGGEPARVVAAHAQVSRDFLRVMGARPRLGREFLAEEQRVGAAPAALVGHATGRGCWKATRTSPAAP